jgi:hypothetical protein
MEKKEETIDLALKKEIAKETGVIELDAIAQEKYCRGFSVGAFSLGPIYFGAMGDWPLLVLALLGGIVFPPIVFILPFFARKRAYTIRKWSSFGHFQQNQKLWDRIGWICLALAILLVWAMLYFLSVYLESVFSGTDLNLLKENLQNLSTM